MPWKPPQPGNRKEHQTAAVFQRQGYLVRSAVPLQIAAAGIDVTDVDLFGVRHSELFQPSRVVVDCKDRVRSRPYERILWARGLGAFIGASDVYVALPKARREVFQFARAGGVRVITDEMLQRAFEESPATSGHAFGLARSEYYDEFYKRHLLVWKKEPDASRLLMMARSLLLAGDSFVSTNLVMSGLGEAARGLRGASDEASRSIWKYVAGELIVVLGLVVLGIASITWGLGPKERSDFIVRRLTFGDVSPAKAQELVNLATQLAALSAAQRGETAKPFDLGEVEPPGYAPDVAGIVGRAIETPHLYLDLPRTLEFLIFDQAIPKQQFDQADFEATFPQPDPQARLKVSRNILALVRDAIGVPLELFWPQHSGAMPRWEESNVKADDVRSLDAARDVQQTTRGDA